MRGEQAFGGGVAVVTGAAGSIGRATALVLAEQGARLLLADHHDARGDLTETVRLCADATPGDVLPTSVAFDVTDAEQVDSVLTAAFAALGPATSLFNNAGYQGLFRNTLDYPIHDTRRVFEVNVVGLLAVLQACARSMAAGGRGAIVNVASMAGVSGAPNMPAYSASKAAVIGLSKAAAKDLAPFNIRVNSISPGFIGPGPMWERQVSAQAALPNPYYDDEPAAVAEQMIRQVPLRRYGELAEVAAAASFLLSDAATYVTGVNLEVSGGAG